MTTYKSIKYNISGADLTGLTAGQIPNLATSKITSGTMADARISASSVTQHAATYDDNKLQSNIALLGFKTAVNGSLAKYNLQDQIIDEYTDATGVDASASTAASLSSGSYKAFTAAADPTSGTVTTPTIDGQAYRVHTFLTSGTFVVASGASNSNVDILVVAGGAGTSDMSGGGGAGGLKNLTGQTVGAGTTTVTVGDGGTARNFDSGLCGEKGDDSVFGSITADGGGGSNFESQGTASNSAMNGGSGGGQSKSTGAIGTGISGQGYNGGTGYLVNSTIAGGGGGASEVGVNGVAGLAGRGGHGIQTNIDGNNYWYAGGGGGHAYDAGLTAGAGGKGGGGGGRGSYGTQGLGDAGNARNNGTNGGAGAGGPAGHGGANTGGGGGGGTNHGGSAGNGGSGIVIVRYIAGSFGTVSSGLTLHNFTIN